jgi:hypothetical protein
MSFRARLTLSYLTLLTLTLTAFGLGVYAYVDRKLHHELYASAQNQSNTFALNLTNYETAAAVNDILGRNKLGNQNQTANPDLYAEVLELPQRPNGRSQTSGQLQVVGKTRSLSQASFNLPIVPAAEFTVIPARLTGPINRPMVAYAENFAAVQPQRTTGPRPVVGDQPQPQPQANKTTITGRVVVALPLDNVEASLGLLRTILIGGGLAVLATAALLGSGLATVLLRPLARMRTTAQ